MRRFPTAFACTALLAATAALPASAALPADDPFADLAPLENEKLAELRGGIDIGGMKFDFAVRIRTTIADAMANAGVFGMTTRLRLDDSGHLAHTVTTPLPGTPAAAVTTTEVPGGIEVQTGNDASQVIHQVTTDHIAVLAQNAANGVSIASDASFDVKVSNFSHVSMDRATNARLHGISRDLGTLGLGR